MGKLRDGKRGGYVEGDALSGGIFTAAGGSKGIERVRRKARRLEGTGKKLIQEGVDGADYACHALRNYGIRPAEWAAMGVPERMFCCAVMELEMEAE